MSTKIFTENIDHPESHTIAHYMSVGGYRSVSKTLNMAPGDIVDEVKKANLRGRGGAGFPAGVKWSFLPPREKRDKPVYLVVNADEGEPGTFKDRVIMEQNPHLLVEGIIDTCIAIGAEVSYIYIRGELVKAARILEDAIEEARKKRFVGKNLLFSDKNVEVYVHRGAGAYVCGEETALLDSIEGKSGQPRNKPPFPAGVGLFGCPTIINNVETISSIPSVINNGGEWFAALGVPKNGGTKLVGVSGHVKKPGVYELPHGISLFEIIYEHAGGPLDKPIKAVVPGGSSCPPLKPDQLDVSLDIESIWEAGSAMGTAGIIVMDERTCMVRVAARLAHFYHHESCGQCTPCREGTGWVARLLDKIEAGKGSMAEIDLLLEVCNNIEGNTICALGDACAMPVRGYLKQFRDEFEKHVRMRKCPFPAW